MEREELHPTRTRTPYPTVALTRTRSGAPTVPLASLLGTARFVAPWLRSRSARITSGSDCECFTLCSWQSNVVVLRVATLPLVGGDGSV
jgi:hypothetical protein